MATQKFKPGDKVKFTQEAKDRFNDRKYWHYANSVRLDVNRVYTIKSYSTGGWPSYSLKEKGTAPYIPDYLLEPAEKKKKNMTKKDFILALVQAIFPDQYTAYYGCHPYAKVHADLDIITVKCPKDKKGNVNLTLSPTYGSFEETDIELVDKFLYRKYGLDYPKEFIRVTDNGDLVMCFGDYPWNLVGEIKPTNTEEPVQEEEQPSPCDDCKVVRKLQAEIQRLKYELDQAKAEKSQTSSDWCKKPKRATVTFEF